MTTELLQSIDSAVSYTPSGRPAASGHSVTLVSPQGVSLSTPEVSLDSIGAAGTVTLTAVTNPTTWTVDSVAGIEPGQRLWWQPAGAAGSVVKVSRVTGLVVAIEGAPAGQPAVGDTLHGITLHATVPGEDLADRGLHHALRWTWTDTTGRVTTEQQGAHVVRQRFAAPCTPEMASDLLGRLAPSSAQSREPGFYVEVANRANERVLRLIRAKASYPHLSGDSTAFQGECGRAALEVELARMGIRVNRQGLTLDELEKACRRVIHETADSLWDDRNDNAQVDDDELAGPIAGAFRMGL